MRFASAKVSLPSLNCRLSHIPCSMVASTDLTLQHYRLGCQSGNCRTMELVSKSSVETDWYRVFAYLD